MMGATMPRSKRIILNKAKALESAEEIKEYFRAENIVKFGEEFYSWLAKETSQSRPPRVELVHGYYHESTSFLLENHNPESIENFTTQRCLSKDEEKDFFLYFCKHAEALRSK